MTTDHDTNDQDDTTPDPITVYQDALTEYLAAATWLTAGDVVFKVHAQQIARSLDAQLTETGQVQSALASTFDKVLARIESRRPKPPAELGGLQVPGQLSIIDPMSD